MATTSSNRLLINLGSQANDGTGDAIRAAFDKVNQNFETIFNVAGIGSGLLLTKLADAPKVLSPNKLLVTDGTGLTATQMSIVGAQGIQVTVDQQQKRVLIDATVTNLVNDPLPTLAANLSGGVVYRGTKFADPVDDQDIATKKWIYDNFLNRDSNYEYITSTNPLTQANVTSTIVEGSTLRHNIQLRPTGVNTATNAGKGITLYTNTGVNTTVFDVSVGAWRPEHLTRKDYVDTKISLQGIDTIDPETGEINPSFGQMTGPLYLSRNPQEGDPGNIAATKEYVDSTGFPSRQNFYVSLNGDDANYSIPAYKRGRSLAWAFRTIQKAAQAALQYSKASEIKLGVYQRVLTTNNYKDPVQIVSIDPGNIAGTKKISVTYVGGIGTDAFIERSIRPGQFLQGITSNAMAEILNVALEPSSNVTEYYEIKYVDYADTFESPITPDDTGGEVTFTLFEPNLIEIPDFWIGYKFIIDDVAGGGAGEIVGFGTYYHPNGNIYNQIKVRMSQPLTSTNIISGDYWHVYSGFFGVGEELRYGQKYNKLEISIMVESGEFNEQLPIRIGDNISVKGDEFRRSVIKPAYVRGTARCGISTSKWADVWFRRDTQVDGMIVVQLDQTTDHATASAVTPDGSTNDASTGVITFTLATGSASADWVGKVFIGANGKGEITAVLGNTFSVDIAENDLGIRKIDSNATIASGDWHIYTPINFGYHYLRDASRPVNYLASPNPGGYKYASKILMDNIEFIKSETIGWIDQTYSGGFTYNVAKCQRDTGLIVDSIAQDILFGNTSQSTFAGVQYWNHGSYVGTIASELTTTTNAISYVKELAQKVITKDLTGTRYQTSVTQSTAGSAATAAEATTLANDFDVILDILANGVAGVSDIIVPNNLTALTDPDVQNAYALLQANKLYIQTEAVAFVEATKTPGFAYDQAKCLRDVGYMIDSVSIDLLYGGNKQAVQSGVYYYGYNASSTALPGEQTQAVAAYNYIKSILPDIIEGNGLTTTYQNVIPQVIIGYTPGSSTNSLTGQSLVDVITDLITNGPAGASAPRPLPLTRSTDPNVINAALILHANRQFIIAETIAFINATYLTGFVYDRDTCKRDVGLIVDALAYDLSNGDINSSINAADSYYAGNVQQVIQNELPQTVGAIGHINDLAQKLLDQIPVTELYGFVPQVFDTIQGEAGAKAQVTNLTEAMQGILNADPAFNPPKYNDEMDIFLMNDATMLRYLGGNGHGGFMKVLDPEGQIKSKSPYTQTCSSFAQSIGRHRFAGGFFVDGFTGNLPLTTTAGTASADTQGNLIYIPVAGVRRKPVFPTYFIHEGVKYEVDWMASYDAQAQTGTLVLNPNNPGGLSSISINSGNTQGEWKANISNLPVTFSSPGTPGSTTARGYAQTNGLGNIVGIVVTFPGQGYTVQPKISLGGATFNFIITGGVITSMTVNYGGVGYTTSTLINIAAPGGSGLTATATITSVDSNGAITGINLVSGGTGYTSVPTVTFGHQVFSANIVKGFIGNLPASLELVTAGNRSMLANDFTQLNDLAYGIFATNGGFIENVSMFTYYCYTSYYALNGAILRTITGSSAYGTYGLIAEGSNPLEVPTAVTMTDELTQIATVYNAAPYLNAKGGADLYVTLDPSYGYAPYANGEVEINHNGVRKTYSLRNSRLVEGTNIYALSLDSNGGGLYQIVPNGEPCTIRIKFTWRLGGLNAATLTRPSTVLTLSENKIYNYRILDYTDLGSDYALAESDQSYDYIQLTPYSVSNVYRQGVGRPQISLAGTGYSSTVTQYTVTFDTPANKTAVVNGAQGTVDAPVSQLTIGSASGAIHPGMLVTGAGAISNQYVTWVSLDRTIIQTSQAQVWSTSSATLTFVGTTATGYAKADGTGITSLVITDPGTGYDSAPGVTIANAGGTTAQATVSLSGTSGTNIIKVVGLSGADAVRITTGLAATTPYYYVFGFEGQTYKITDYKTPAQTGQAWGEIQLTGYNNAFATLQREMMADPLYAGVTKNTPGTVTVQISTLRATAHDMIDIGTGGYATSKIPNDLYGPPTIAPKPANEVLEKGKGRVYYVTTDQDGNFRVGKYFAVDQGRGTVTISAPISLTGISKLSFKKGVTVDEFSKDDTMAASSLSKVPVESAIIGYIDKRLGVDKTGAVASGIIGPGVMALNGAEAMTGSLNMGSKQLINLAVPTTSSDGATKGYVDGKISLDGMNEVTNDGGQEAGIMNGPLRLNADPAVTTASTTATVALGASIVYLNSVSGLYKGMQLNTSGFAPGSYITDIDSVGNYITVSAGTIGSVSSGVTVTFDPVRQGATKRYVDRSAQISKLRDVVLTSAADTDLLMFASNLAATSSTATPLYEAARSVINVTNDTATITNTSTANGGGSDVTFTRTNNKVAVKLVGGQGSANPITNYHVNDNAAIAQSKLNMQAAGVTPSSVGVVQASRGLAVFDQYVFTATNGWISLVDSVATTDGIAPSKLRQVAAGGALIGNTNLAAGGAMTYLSSSTVRSWLGVIDSASGGTFNGPLNVQNIYPNATNTYFVGSSTNTFKYMYATTGSFTNVFDNSNRVVTTINLNAGNAIGVASSKSNDTYTLSVTNLGVRDLTGTANRITVSSSTGSVTLNLPQDIATNSDVTFNRATLEYLTANAGATVEGTWTLGAGASFQATYADLAERYSADSEYEPGTVLVFGGEREVTVSTMSNDRKVAGVVSTNPAYDMNVECPNGVSIALQGRVPCKVVGYIRKGDLMVSSHIPGVAMANNDPKMGTVIGKALEDYQNTEVGVIEVAVGRL